MVFRYQTNIHAIRHCKVRSVVGRDFDKANDDPKVTRCDFDSANESAPAKFGVFVLDERRVSWELFPERVNGLSRRVTKFYIEDGEGSDVDLGKEAYRCGSVK